MTPRLAFAIALAFSSSAAMSDKAISQDHFNRFNNSSLQPDSPDNNSRDATLKIGQDGVLPVIELNAPVQLPETIDLTVEPEELFQRIRRGFAMPNLNNSLVLHHQQYYQNHPDYLRRMVERSSRYLHHIVEELDKRGMPMELALLPMVESAYNPTAYSRSRASGLWQFVPSTGKQYKLEQNSWVDERRDIVASTAAALDYLQYIYELHGDWHLALASYNWGEGAVGRAINKNKAQGLSTDYQNLSMPEETRNYVPKLQALKNIFSNPRVLSLLNLHGVPNRPYFATITRPHNIDVKLAAQLAEMSEKEFVVLNPAHNRPVIKSETPMVIPADKVATFLSNIEAHQASDKPFSSWQSYQLRSGEKLEQVASRFGMTVASLKAANGLNNRARIEPGTPLMVATREASTSPEALAMTEDPLAATEKMRPSSQALPVLASTPDPDPDLAPTATISPAPAKVKTESSAAAGAVPRTHTVAKGESLLKIAQRYGLTLGEVRQINHLRSDKVTIGSRLIVIADDRRDSTPRTVVAEVEKKPLAVTRESANETAWQMHTVQKGETLQKIAQRHDMTLAEIRQINKLRADQVNVGSKLKVAADERQPTASRTVVAEAEKKPQSAQRDSAGNSSMQTHIVRKGESLRNIAQRYGMSLAQLKEINHLRTDKASIGGKLVVAASEAVSNAAARRAELVDNEHKSLAGRHETTSNASSSQMHLVREGDTLAKVADRYGMTVAELKQRNKLHGGPLVTGTRLAVNDSETSEKASAGKSRSDQLALLETRQDKRTEAHEKPAKARNRQRSDDDEVSKVKSRKQPKLAQYTIRRGDTLNSIAKQFRVEKDDLLRWNRLPATAIKPGQTLTIQLVQNSL